MSLVGYKAIAVTGAGLSFPVESCLGGSKNEESAAVNFLSLLLLMISSLRWKIATQKTPKEEATYRTPG